MKLLATIFLFSCYYLSSFSQCGSTPYGAYNFKDSLFAIDSLRNADSSTKMQVPYAKTPINPGLVDVTYKRRVTQNPKPNGDDFKDEDCNGNNPVTCKSDGAQCFYIVYYPKGIDYSTCKLPSIVLFHGGGFSDCKSTGDGSNIDVVAREFAKRGYVAFLVEYRTGRYVVPPTPGTNYLSAQQSLATYRAFQDARGAMRTIIFHQRKHATTYSSEPYQIDTTKMFIGGNSAGSIIAIHTAYYNASQIAQVFPTLASPTVKDLLGPIDADYYVGDTTIDLSTRIRGVLDMWGQASFPLSARSNLAGFWQGNTRIPPLIGFHGFQDSTLPIDTIPIRFAPNVAPYAFYNSDTTCLKGLKYTLEGVANTDDLMGAGSRGIRNILKSLGKSVELYVDCDMKHGVRKTTDNFGLTGITDPDQVYLYIVQRAATFFQAVLTGKDNLLNRDQFYDCVNERVKSTPNSQLADSPTTCLNGNNPCMVSGARTGSALLYGQPTVSKLEKEMATIEVYPNPASRILSFNVSGIKNYQAMVIDASGKTIRTTNTNTASHGEIPIGELRPGLYFLKVQSGNQILHTQFIKQ